MISEIVKQSAEMQTSQSSVVESGPGGFEVPGAREVSPVDDAPTGFDAKEIGELRDIPADLTPVVEDAAPEKVSQISDATETTKISAINEDLEGKRHPETGVYFERVTVTLPDGTKVEGVFPEFESAFDTSLDDGTYWKSRWEHAKDCNGKLKEAVANDPELAKKFSPEQLEQIKNGETPDGYVWHHNQEPGKMQLVDEKTHSATGHTGGYSLWGGKQS